MPTRPARACAHRGCTRLVRGRGARFCNMHQAEEYHRQDQDRGSATERGYGATWQAIRDRFLADHPTCQHCGRLATVVHHIVPKGQGGGDNPDNLLALCNPCHSRVHAAEGKKEPIIIGGS